MGMWEVFWVTYALNFREYLTLYQEYITQYFYFTFKNFKAFFTS